MAASSSHRSTSRGLEEAGAGSLQNRLLYAMIGTVGPASTPRHQVCVVRAAILPRTQAGSLPPRAGLQRVPGSNLEGGLIPGGGSGNTQQINQICRFSSIPQTLRFGYNSNRRSVYSVHQNEIKRQHVNILELGDSQGRPRRGSKRLLRISSVPTFGLLISVKY